MHVSLISQVLESEFEMAMENYGRANRKRYVALDGKGVDVQSISLPRRLASLYSCVEVSNTLTVDAS